METESTCFVAAPRKVIVDSHRAYGAMIGVMQVQERDTKQQQSKVDGDGVHCWSVNKELSWRKQVECWRCSLAAIEFIDAHKYRLPMTCG